MKTTMTPMPLTLTQAKTMKTHNIGGSILPSSCPQILQPIAFNGRVLQVVPDYDADTHRLTLDGQTIASHPNGYSCHHVAKHMAAGDTEAALKQAHFIVACGGSADLAEITNLLTLCKP